MAVPTPCVTAEYVPSRPVGVVTEAGEGGSMVDEDSSVRRRLSSSHVGEVAVPAGRVVVHGLVGIPRGHGVALLVGVGRGGRRGNKSRRGWRY